MDGERCCEEEGNERREGEGGTRWHVFVLRDEEVWGYRDAMRDADRSSVSFPVLLPALPLLPGICANIDSVSFFALSHYGFYEWSEGRL